MVRFLYQVYRHICIDTAYMASIKKQVFCKEVGFHLVEPLLQKICEPIETTGGAYVLDETAFLRMQYYGYEPDFIQGLRPYYYTSKLYYIDRKLTFKSLSTIVRQICKASGKNISSQIKYFHSNPLTVITILP